MNEEQQRLAEMQEKGADWRFWGPYLSERQWGTVREDYSADGDAWRSFPFEQSHQRAYRWGEDGIAGISDIHQRLCFAFSFWNGKDPILKERLFGLTNAQGNHGEDVKEYYFYLDNTPTHSYMKALYKYPVEAFPYELLKTENQKRGTHDPEFELIDTSLFAEDRYFDLFMEYAKGSAHDLCIRLQGCNRSSQKEKIHILPTLWFRNTWRWKGNPCDARIEKIGTNALLITHPEMGKTYFYYEENPTLLFTENESNLKALYGTSNPTPYVKDAFGQWLIQGQKDAVNPQGVGSKAALYRSFEVAPKGSFEIRFRLSDRPLSQPFADMDETFKKRRSEADRFYRDSAPSSLTEEQRLIQRQAYAGLLWSKQYYCYSVEDWLQGDRAEPPPPPIRKKGRNSRWRHFRSDEVISMPDTWEYPWFAAWDLSFHSLTMSLIDPDFAKKQLLLLTREWFMHPSGQLPAYEWNFDDCNPPVLSWAAWRIYKIEQRKHGHEDRPFLEQIFQKLLLNFTWWVNRKDSDGRNVFEGGFLGLDNISLFNRSSQLPHGGKLTQSDATSWMAMFCLQMWTMAMELADQEPIYEEMACKFYEHFLYIALAMNRPQADSPSLWNEEDGFYYDVLQTAEGAFLPLKIRSMVGLIPLFAVATLEEEKLNRLPQFLERFQWFLDHQPNLCQLVACMQTKGTQDRHLLSLLSAEKLKRVLSYVLDEKEFLSPYGIRSVSKIHQEHPFKMSFNGTCHQVDYEPAESTSRLFGGNSNWRGPIWFPLNYLLIESLQKYHYYYGDDFRVECPTGSGKYLTLKEVAEELSRRLVRIFEANAEGRRAVFGGVQKFQTDAHFKDYLLFYEYFHGDNGAGIGASHQTGWTALVAKLIQQLGLSH